MGSQLDPLPLSRVESRERASKSQLSQLDFVEPSSGFHPVTWERVTNGLPNFQSAIAGVKTHRFEKFFISLEIYWNIYV
jgi:hypothetical protein